MSVTVCISYVVNFPNRTRTFMWYRTRLVVKNLHQKDISHIKIGLCAQM